MKSAMHMVIFSAILLLVSCSSVRPQSPLGRLTPLSPGQAKLTSIQMPEYVHENLPYDVILGFNSEGELNVKRVCFKWLSGQASFSTSSSECLMGNNEGGSTGDSCLVQPRFEIQPLVPECFRRWDFTYQDCVSWKTDCEDPSEKPRSRLYNAPGPGRVCLQWKAQGDQYCRDARKGRKKPVNG